jgi:hypothetical protein
MNGNDSEAGDQALNSSSTARKPWYRQWWIWIIGILLVLSVSAYQFYRPIEVTRGPWQVLDPGKPVEPLKFDVVQEGTGAMVEPGDLVWVSMWFWSRENDVIEQRDDNWWIWVGFRAKEETPFHSIDSSLLSAFVGQREGGGVRFTESPSQNISAGEVYTNPFGSYSAYPWGKSKSKSKTIYIPCSSGYTIVHITKVFKGQLKYRTTRLYDDTWIHHCYDFLSCRYTNAPREGWMDEARYNGVSADGQRATFQYGPVATPGMVWTGPATHYSAGNWSDREWEKLPRGVQLDRSAKDGDARE